MRGQTKIVTSTGQSYRVTEGYEQVIRDRHNMIEHVGHGWTQWFIELTNAEEERIKRIFIRLGAIDAIIEL